jgi:hypothetical protein
VLIYDRKCRDIISPLLNVSKLRKRGVTLHLLLEAEREDIPDVVSRCPLLIFPLSRPSIDWP